MKKNIARTVRTALVLLVGLSLVIPAGATAAGSTGVRVFHQGPGAGSGPRSSATSAFATGAKGLGIGNDKRWTPQRTERLRGFLKQVLERRTKRFNNVSANVQRRIDRVSAITDIVANAGGDVTQVRALLDQARAQLAAAVGEEANAGSMFLGIADATGKREAFRLAKQQGKVAVAKLREARRTTTQAIVLLRSEVARLLKQAESETATESAGATPGPQPSGP